MSQELPTTSYALLGLLSFGDELTGYELKQRADSTLRFYWVSPAMSQVYSELGRLTEHGLVTSQQRAPEGPTRYQITAEGRRDLRQWLTDEPADFPALKHPVALRLLLGHLIEPAEVEAMLDGYLGALSARRQDLQAVHDGLKATRGAPDDAFRFPRLVADWGLDYYDSERDIVLELLRRIRAADL